MYGLYRNVTTDNWEPIGFYDNEAEAICALIAERQKEDGIALMIKAENDDD